MAARGLGWHRAGERVAYYGNAIRRGRGGSRSYFTLSFTLTAEYDNDLIHVAHCYPYTFTDLQRYLKALEEDPLRKGRVTKREALATSLAGNVVDVLTITSPCDDAEALKRRKAVVISGACYRGLQGDRVWAYAVAWACTPGLGKGPSRAGEMRA